MNFTIIKETVIRGGSRALLLAQKHSPELLMLGGTVAIGAGMILTGKASLKLNDILDEHEEIKEKIEKAHNGEIDIPEDKEYTDEDYKHDILVNKIDCGKKIAMQYIPAVSCVVLGIGCFFGAHGIMSKRNVALMGAYKLVEGNFKAYRERVKNELGEDKDRHFYYGTETEKISEKVKDENGKTKTVKKEVEVVDEETLKLNPYIRIFDEANPNWSKSPEQNKFFLERAQNVLTDKLRAQGHLFLNEVYDYLGFDRSSIGAKVGWVADGIGNHGDDYVDFQIIKNMNAVKRDFINGYEPSIILDFNVQGVIWDLI